MSSQKVYKLVDRFVPPGRHSVPCAIPCHCVPSIQFSSKFRVGILHSGISFQLNWAELAVLDVQGIGNHLCEAGFPQYRQAFADFGIDGSMVIKLPRDDLGDVFRLAGIGSESDIEVLLQGLDKILQYPKVDRSKLDRKRLRELLMHSEATLNGWNQSSKTSYNWTGISFDLGERITAIEIAKKNLSGTFSPGLGDITHLERLHASCNRFTGEIPGTIGALSRLTSLRLDHNNLSGRLPRSLTCLSNLAVLDLACNKLAGTLPVHVGAMSSLQRLSLGMNKLTGTIPKELGSLHLITELRMQENKLEGEIPQLLGDMYSLQTLDLSSNRLQGLIPEKFGNLTNLRNLWLSDNKLLGRIPETLSMLTNLQSLDLSSNKLAAKLPRNVFQALSPSLVFLNLSRNEFEGKIPLGDLVPPPRSQHYKKDDVTPEAKAKEDSELYSREATPLADEMRGSPLSFLNLSHNKLTGSVPEEIGALTSLTTLDLSFNNLRGPLPPEIGGCSALRTLSLSRCCLTGRLDTFDKAKGIGPRSLGRLTLLETLRLDGNSLEGSVPMVIGTLLHLEVLQLQANCFSGYLPPTLGQLNRLRELYVRDNQLSGRVSISYAYEFHLHYQGCATKKHSILD